MHSVSLICLVVVAVCAAPALARPQSSYTTKYDNVDVKEVLGNPRMLDAYMKCVLGMGKCSAEGRELKSHIKEALETNCAKCSAKQRTNVREVIAHLINKEPTYWKQLVDKYDSSHKFVVMYESELRTMS